MTWTMLLALTLPMGEVENAAYRAAESGPPIVLTGGRCGGRGGFGSLRASRGGYGGGCHTGHYQVGHYHGGCHAGRYHHGGCYSGYGHTGHYHGGCHTGGYYGGGCYGGGCHTGGYYGGGCAGGGCYQAAARPYTVYYRGGVRYVVQQPVRVVQRPTVPAAAQPRNATISSPRAAKPVQRTARPSPPTT